MRLSLVILILLFTVVAQPTLASVEIGQAAVVRGVVNVERAGEKQILNAKDKVYQGDKITTGEKGRVQLILVDDTIFTIGRAAEILLDKYVYDPSTHDGASEVKAKKGTFKFVTGKIAKKDPRSVKVKTPFATIGVRGSGGVVGVLPNGMTTVGLTQCCLDVFANGAPAGTPPVPLNDLNSFSQVEDPNMPPTPPAPMPPEMVQQMNGDLSGGFAPIEGEEGDFIGEPGDGAEGPATEGDEGGDGNQPPEDDGGPVEGEGDGQQPPEDSDNPPEGDGQQPPEGSDNPPPPEDNTGPIEGDAPPPPEGGDNPPPPDDGGTFVEGSAPPPPEDGGTFTDAGAPPPPPPGDDGGTFTDFGTFDTTGGDPLAGGSTAPDGTVLLDPVAPDGGTTDPTLAPPPPPPVDTTQSTQDTTNADIITTSTAAGTTHIGVFKRKNANETIVREGDMSGSLSTGQFLGTFNDFDGTTFTGALPVPGTAGDFVQPGFGFDGIVFSGDGYKTANNDYLLYNLASADGSKLYVATGTTIPVPTSGVDNFTFQSDPFSSDAQSTNQNNPGTDGDLVIDWTRKKYLGGSIEIQNTDANNFRYAATAGFGDVLASTSSNGTNALGVLVDLQKEKSNGALRDTIIATGTTEAVEIFGTGTEVSGFILDIDKETGNLPLGNTQNQTEYSLNPIVRAADDAQTLTDITNFSSNLSLRGFLGGYIMKVDAADGTAEAFDRISNRVTNNQIDGGISMFLNTNGDGSASLGGWTGSGDFYNVEFGADGGGDSAVIAEEAYALEQIHSDISRFNIFVGASAAPSPSNEGRAYVFDRNGNNLTVWDHTTAGTTGLVAPDGAFADGFASRVDMYGKFAIAGASEDDWDADGTAGDEASVGSAYIYGRSSAGGWGYMQKIVASDAAAGDLFGSDVAIYGDLAIVGAAYKDAGAADTGAAYIFKWNGSSWAEATPLLASDRLGSDLFGSSVDIYGDYAVVGAWGVDVGGSNDGSVYVYKWNGSAWVENQIIDGTDTLDAFGYSVAMDNDLLVVGAPDVSVDGADDDGAIYIYRRDSTGTYVPEASFNSSVATGNAHLGTSVDVQGDTVVASQPLATSNQGSVSVFQYDSVGGTWSHEANITAGDAAANTHFGKDVRISNNLIVVGSTGATGDSGGAGAFYVYERQPQTGGNYAWVEIVQSQGAGVGDIGGANVGDSVAFSGPVISTQDDGALISESLADVTQQCTACKYVHWGVWAGRIENTEVLSSSDSAVANLIPYVAGEVLDASTLNSFTGNATYTGITIGSILDETANSLRHHTGSMTASVDFTNRNVTLNADLGSYNFTASGTSLWTSGENAFNITSVTGTGISSGEVNGAFFGHNAQDIGGNFQFNGTGYSAAGVYLGNDATR